MNKNSYEWRRMIYKRDAIRAQRDLYNRPLTNAQYAVYYAPAWEEWQEFRLSLKGMSIDEKLDTLRTAWGVFSHTLDDEELYIERIRFVNYLGALLRGGFEEARPMYNKLKEGGL